MISSQEHKATYLHRISINYHHTALLAATTEYTSLTDTLNVINHISVKKFFQHTNCKVANRTQWPWLLDTESVFINVSSYNICTMTTAALTSS